MTELMQKRLWDRRHFKLLEKELWIHVKSPTADYTMTIKYENLGLDVVYLNNKAGSLVMAVLAVISSLGLKLALQHLALETTQNAFLFYAASAVFLMILIVAWSEMRKPLIVLSGGEKNVGFLAKRPNEKAVDAFLSDLKDKIKVRLIELRVRPNNPQISEVFKREALDCLLEDGIIDQQQYDIVWQHIQEQRTSNKQIGFGGNLSSGDFVN